MEGTISKIVEIIKKLCNVIIALFWCYAPFYLVILALCKKECTIYNFSTFLFHVVLYMCLWTYIVRQIIIEITTFYSARNEKKDETWNKLSFGRFTIMMLLCFFFCWINFMLYNKLF